jgi:tetratricopeptide (TPR) repeat protein
MPGFGTGKVLLIGGILLLIAVISIAVFALLPMMAAGSGSVSGLGISSNPQAQSWNHQAWALNAKGKFSEANDAADKAAGLDPKSADAWANKGWALDGLKKYTEALTALDKATSLDPDNAITWSNKGFAQLNLGKCADAVASFDKALALDPYDYGAINYRKVAGRCR